MDSGLTLSAGDFDASASTGRAQDQVWRQTRLPKFGILPNTEPERRRLIEVSASSVHAEFGSSVHAGPDRLCTRAFFAPDRLYTQCLLLCTRRDRGVDSCMFPCLSVV